MQGNTITIFGNGEQLRDYIYVKDLVEAFMMAAVDEKAYGETFNIGSGTRTKFKDMAKLFIEYYWK